MAGGMIDSEGEDHRTIADSIFARENSARAVFMPFHRTAGDAAVR